MDKPLDFEAVKVLSNEARANFAAGAGSKAAEISLVFDLFCEVFRSLGIIYDPHELAGSRQEAAAGVLVQALETVLAMYSLSQDGFWDSALVLKRNYSELLVVAMAIGYDQECFTDWKNERSSFSSFGKICRRVQRSEQVPKLEKSLLPLLKQYWGESSQSFSHRVRRGSVRTLMTKGEVRFEPKVASHEFQRARMNTIRNMLVNLLSLLLGVTQFSARGYARRERFPQGAQLIAEANRCFCNEVWKDEPTS